MRRLETSKFVCQKTAHGLVVGEFAAEYVVEYLFYFIMKPP